MLSLVHVQKDHGRNKEKWLVLLELDLSPWWGPDCPVIPKLSLHHGGKLRPLLKSLQTDWKELEVQKVLAVWGRSTEQGRIPRKI